MKWVTREHVHVDRVACPWLIKRFVDPGAELLFVPKDQVMSAAKAQNAIPYDANGQAELDHHEGRCSFESIMLKYNVTDPGVVGLAKIVHAADVAADRDTAPEAAGLAAIAKGFGLTYPDNDLKNLEMQFPVYDALYQYCKAKATKV